MSELMEHRRTVNLGHGRRAVEFSCLNCGEFTAIYTHGFLVQTTESTDVSQWRAVAEQAEESWDGKVPSEAAYDDVLSEYPVKHDSQALINARGMVFTEIIVTCAHCEGYSALYEGEILVGIVDDTEGNTQDAIGDMITKYADLMELPDDEKDDE